MGVCVGVTLGVGVPVGVTLGVRELEGVTSEEAEPLRVPRCCEIEGCDVTLAEAVKEGEGDALKESNPLRVARGEELDEGVPLSVAEALTEAPEDLLCIEVPDGGAVWLAEALSVREFVKVAQLLIEAEEVDETVLEAVVLGEAGALRDAPLGEGSCVGELERDVALVKDPVPE